MNVTAIHIATSRRVQVQEQYISKDPKNRFEKRSIISDDGIVADVKTSAIRIVKIGEMTVSPAIEVK